LTAELSEFEKILSKTGQAIFSDWKTLVHGDFYPTCSGFRSVEEIESLIQSLGLLGAIQNFEPWVTFFAPFQIE